MLPGIVIIKVSSLAQAAGPRTRHHRRNIFMIELFLEKCFHVTATTSFLAPAIRVDDNVQYEVINNQNKAH